MNNFDSPGFTLTVPAPAALLSGVAFVYGALLLIPVTDAAEGDDVAAAADGVFSLPKAAGAIAGGAAVAWDDTAKQVVTSGGDLSAFGVSVRPVESDATTVLVKLTPGTGVPGGS